MRVLTVIPLSAAVGAMVALLPAGHPSGGAPRTQADSDRCRSRIAAAAVGCADSEPQKGAGEAPLRRATPRHSCSHRSSRSRLPRSGGRFTMRWSAAPGWWETTTGSAGPSWRHHFRDQRDPPSVSPWGNGSSWCATTRPTSGMRCCTTFSRRRDGSLVYSSRASTTPSRTCIRCRSSGCAREGGDAAA
jgi:hypothetical protein